MLNNITCQNCLEYMAQIKTESVDCCITDCPYKIIAGGVRVVYDDNHSIDYSKTNPKGVLNSGKRWVSDGTVCSNAWIPKKSNISSASKDGKMFDYNEIEFKDWLPELYRVMKNATHTYIMVNSRNLKDLQIESEKVGFVFQNLLVWDKKRGTPNKYYMQSAEFILMLRKGKARNINDMGTKTVLSILNFTGKGEKRMHPTQKPISLLEILLLNSTSKNDIVLDPFCGSGSLALTCQKHNRNYLCCDIDQDYVDMANKNLEVGWQICQENWGETVNNIKQQTLF